MEELNIVITEEGLKKIARATIEEPLVIDRFGVGDGNGEEVELEASRTSLVNEKYRDYVNNKYSNNNNIVIECVLRANAPITEGFYLREIGLFDEEGILIAHAKLPEQYRPPYEEGQIVTESIFNIDLRIENSENIQVKIEETIFATEDSVQRLLERVEILEQNKKDLIESSVGVEKLFNTDNKYKDQDIVQIGVKTWGLSGSIVKIADYLQAFKNCGAVDKGDGTFEIPKMYDGTIRHLPKGVTRCLGSYEDSSTSLPKTAYTFCVSNTSPTGSTNTTGNHTHPIPLGNPKWNGISKGRLVDPSSYYVESTVDASGSHSHTVTTNPHNHTVTISGGDSETRMKNTAGQWYLLLKMDI